MSAIHNARQSIIGTLVLLGSSLVASPLLAQAQPAKPVTIEFYGIASGGWQPVIDDFQAKYPHITVKWTKYGVDDLKQALRVGASSRRMPTMWYNWGGSLAAPYNQADLSLDMTDLLKQANLTDRLNPTAIRLATDEGKIRGFPYRLIPTGIFYRKDILEQNGIAEPKSFKDLEAAADALAKKNVTPFATGGKFGWMTMRYMDYLIEHVAGPQKHDALKALEASWDSPEVVQAYTKLKEWTDKGYFNKGFITVDPSTAVTMLYGGQAAMVMEGPGIEAARLLRDNVDRSRWGTFVPPTDHQPTRSMGYITQLQVSANAPREQRDAAISFLQHLASADNATKFLPSLGGPSAVLGAKYGEDLSLSRNWVNNLEGGLQFFLPADQGLPQELVGAYFETNDAVILGSLTPQQAAAQMESAVKRYKAQR
jgi:raffinose/stachyose/melibiose transport system substrate-binding protein